MLIYAFYLKSAATSYLILQKVLIGHVYDVVHTDDSTNGVDIQFCQHSENQDRLHQQLPVLRLRNTVQNRLHVDGKLDLLGSHLKMNPNKVLYPTTANDRT